MTAALHIGPGFSIPIDAVTTSSGTFGIRGSGKTNTNVVVVEELLKNSLQVAIIDPTDVWWGLKSSKDGTRAGYPIIVLGGRHADLPLGGGDGNTIADFVVDTGASVVLSLRHFETDAEKRRLITDFARRLYHRKGQQDAPSPIMVVIDEASLVVPQRVLGEDAKMVGAIQRLVRQGRSSGIGVNLIDARPATVNKDVLAGVEMLVTHRITSPKDRKALLEYVEQHDPDGNAVEFLKELASLGEGEAWFWSPGWLGLFKRVKVRERRTFDSSRTPKPGETAIVPTKMADIDLEAVRAKLGASIEKAKTEDPKELQKRIHELETALRKVHPISSAAVKQAMEEHARAAVREERKRIYDQILPIVQNVRAIINAHEKLDGSAEALRSALALAKGDSAALWHALEGLRGAVDPKVTRISDLTVRTSASLAPGEILAVEDTAVRVNRKFMDAAPRHERAIHAGLNPSEQKLLNALALIEKIGASRDVTTLAFFAGYTVAGRFNNLKGGLRAKGYLEYPREGEVELTDSGRAVADADGAEVQNRVQLHSLWFSKLPQSEGKVLDVVIGAYPRSIEKEDLARATDYTIAGRFNNILGRLRGLGAIEYPQPGHVRASKALFPDGL